MQADDIVALFAANGALTRHITGYRPRTGQQILAHAVADNLQSDGILLAEAGTGTGKSFAYLVPTLIAGQKTLISTAGKNLQEQIYYQDIPRLAAALQTEIRVCLLKGRNNYLCQQRYEKYHQTLPENAEESHWREALEAFYATTSDGDLMNLTNVPENAPIFPLITSTADNCLQKNCQFYEQCFVRRARLQAKEADIIIVNHHLLLADLVLRDEDVEILPAMKAFIIDEAHHLPKVALQFLGHRFTSGQLFRFFSDVRRVVGEFSALDAQKIIACHDALFHGLPNDKPRLLPEDFPPPQKFADLLQQLSSLLRTYAKKLQQHLDTFFSDPADDDEKETRAQILKLITRARRLSDEIRGFTIASSDKDPRARWLDQNPAKETFSLSSVPVDISPFFARWIANSGASWTFLSATLAVDGKFDYFVRDLGLKKYRALLVPNEFDYPRQAVLYHPTNLPNPNAADYTPAMIAAILPILKRSRGRALLLFTSYRALNAAKKALAGENFTLLTQGEMPKTQLLQTFRTSERALLLATASFWEGVDVRGEKLVCVVIDKLPFATPDDPIVQARHKMLQNQGLSPFMADTLPQAILTLKQGVGRLIRGVDDYGVLVLADPRLSEKSYGKIFLASLPQMSKTRKIDVIDRFFTLHEGK